MTPPRSVKILVGGVLFWWRVRDGVGSGGMVAAIEVKSSRAKETLPGMDAFARAFNPQRKLLFGGQGIPIGEFLLVLV